MLCGRSPEEDGESYALTIHGMIHRKEASLESTTRVGGCWN